MALREVREIDRQLAQASGGIERYVPEAAKGGPAEKTADVLTSLLTSLGWLKAGTLDLAEAGNLYATYGLFRIFLEHLLKSLAIFSKAAHEHSDVFAEQYLRLRVKEASELLGAYEAAKIVLEQDSKHVLSPWFAEAQALTNGALNDLAAPFKYRRLIRTISELSGVDQPNYLSRIIPNYSELSGFVHGGPSARMILEHFPTDESKTAELVRVAELTVDMYYSAKRNLLELATAINSQFNPYRDALEAALEASRRP